MDDFVLSRVESMDEDKLLELCINGDKKAFSQLIELNRRLIETAAFRIVKSNVAVQEVVQEALIRIFKGLKLFNRQCKISTWMYRITVNEGLRYLQKESGHATTPLDQIDEIPVTEVCALQSIVLKEQKKMMKEFVDELPSEFKEVVVLHYFEEMKLENIADKLNIPSGTVFSRIGRARDMLKKKIKAYA